LLNFTKIYRDLKSNRLDMRWLTDIEGRNNLFPNINYRLYSHS